VDNAAEEKDIRAGKPAEKKDATAGKPKEFIYRCVTKCTYGGKLVRVGETIILNEKKDIPYFEPVK
jgi:hypothetical protein